MKILSLLFIFYGKVDSSSWEWDLLMKYTSVFVSDFVSQKLKSHTACFCHLHLWRNKF